MATHNVKNISTGIRGFYASTGLVELPVGATAENVEISDAELRSAQGTGWFEIDGSTDKPAAEEKGPADDLDTTVAELKKIAEAEGVELEHNANKAAIQQAIRDARTAKAQGGAGTSELDGMDDATLLTTTAAITGTPEADLQGKDRDELLRLARGES